MSTSVLKRLLTWTDEPSRSEGEAPRNKPNRLISFFGQRVGGAEVARSFDADPNRRVPDPIARDFDFDQSADHEEVKW